MALQAGFLTVKLLYAVELKDRDWFGKQDPYCKVFAGGQYFRSKTHKNGGKSPVWNETFKYSIINDNTITIELYDEDTFKDDLIGRAVVDLSAVRTSRTQHVTVPVIRPKSGKPGGSVVLDLEFQPQETSKGAAFPEPNKYVAASAAAAAAYAYALGPYPQARPAAGYPAQSAPSKPPGYPCYPCAPAAPGYPKPSGHSAPPGYPSAPSYGTPPAAGYPQPSGPSAPPGYPGAPQYGAPPPGYPTASAASYSGPPAGYPPAGSYSGPPPGYPPAGYPPAGCPSGGHCAQPQRPPQSHGGMGGNGIGMAMGALGAIAAGLSFLT